jgi:hypothetical protein
MFSLNSAWAIVWITTAGVKYAGGPVVASYFARVFRKALPHVSTIGSFRILEQVVWSFVLAAVVFASLHALSRFGVAKIVLRTLAGATAITSFPLAVWIFPAGFFSPVYRFEAYHIGLFCEVMVIVFYAILHYLRRPPLSSALMLIALVIHFTIWAWVTGSYANIPACLSDFRNSTDYHSWWWSGSLCSLRMIFTFGFPVIGFLASVTWVSYIKFFPSDSIHPMSHFALDRRSKMP